MTMHNASNSLSTRHGTTLIETAILISLTAVLSGIIVTGMAALFRYNRSTDRHHVHQTALQQMTTALRADIHEASRCLWNAESQTLRLELTESRVLEYRVIKQRWVRVLQAEAEPITTSFGLDESFRCYCQAEQSKRGELIRMTLTNQPLELPTDKLYEESGRTERTLRSDIVAQVGRHFSTKHHEP